MAKPLTFVITTFTHDAKDFEVLAKQAVRLQRHGQVQLSLSSLAEKSAIDLPEGGSAWHEYTSYLPSLEKFVPHADIAPFIDRQHVAKNVKLLRECAKVMRKYKMGAAFHFHLPRYLPEKYFAKYPHRRGPRVDHPRRSCREEFSPCADLPENLEIWSAMWGALCKEVPEMGTAIISTNDAGGGLCWGDWIYSGPNGPTHCRHRGVGPRVKGMIQALRKGAGKVEVDYDYAGNFSENEWQALEQYHDAKFQTRTQSGVHPRQVHIGSSKANVPVSLGLFNPFVKCLMNPVLQLVELERLKDPKIEAICIDVTNIYNRGHEPAEATEKLLEMVDAFVAERPFGRVRRAAFLRKLCARWVGEDQADTLVEALYDLHEVIEFRAAALPTFFINECGVVARHINRPLVAKPELLTKEEEDYWLPYVFNRSREAARLDYIDIQGGRMAAGSAVSHDHYGRTTTVEMICGRLNGIADRLEGLKGEGADVFRKMSIAARIAGSALRSAGNFYGVQQVRDRNAAKFAGEKQAAWPKVGNWVGNPDLQVLMRCIRDEMDNTTELIRILENGGLELVVTAKRPEDEDCFLLGPNLLPQLKRKLEIMRRHWVDAEGYLETPFK